MERCKLDRSALLCSRSATVLYPSQRNFSDVTLWPLHVRRKSLKWPIKSSCYRNTGDMNSAPYCLQFKTCRRKETTLFFLHSDFSTMNLGQEVSVKTISLVHEASSMIQLTSFQTQSSLNNKINIKIQFVPPSKHPRPSLLADPLTFLTHCGRVTQICVFNTVKLGTSASSP